MTVRGCAIFVFNQATQVNPAFHPSGVDKSGTGLPDWGEDGARNRAFTCVGWQVTPCDPDGKRRPV